MALKKCKECGGKVSSKADQCPHCGAKTKRQSIGCGGLLLILFIIGIIGSIMNQPSPSSNTTPPPPKPKTQKELRTEKISAGFSAWDGSHIALERLIKKTMNDPDSYEHEETVYWDQGDDLIVKTTFRGKNGFGGVVKNWVKAKVDLNGNVLQVLEQGP